MVQLLGGGGMVIGVEKILDIYGNEAVFYDKPQPLPT